MFYTRYVELCKEAGLSPSAAALKMGISKSSVSYWKSSGATPDREILEKISSFFHVTLDYLVGNVNEPYFYLDNKRILDEINSYGDEKPAAESDGREKITFDDFAYAMHGASQDLSDDDKDLLLSMAQQLADRRKKKGADGNTR